MSIPFVDFTREYYAIQKEIDSAIQRVLSRGYFILGPEVEQFEQSFARYIGTRFAVGVASGTDALYLSLLALGVGNGDEVLLPTHTAVPTAMAVVMSGATPVFVDSDESFLMDTEKLHSLVTSKTKAIIPVHFYGLASDMGKLRAFVDKHKLLIIEDCAQATGAEWNGKKVGSFGDAGCFSFYPTKNLGTYGDGGMVVTDNEELYQKLRALRYYGELDKVTCEGFGINSRLDELHAALLSAKLPHLDVWNAKRQEIAGWYRQYVTNPLIVLPDAFPAGRHVYHLFVARAKNRDALREKLKQAGVATMLHYPHLVHEQPFFKQFVSRRLPKAEALSQEIFSLPMHPFLTEDEVASIGKVLSL